MRILVVEPERRPEVREIDGSLEIMQGIVGGLIQVLYPFDEPVALVCNDEAKLMDLQANRGLRDQNGQIYDIICGTFFLLQYIWTGKPGSQSGFLSISRLSYNKRSNWLTSSSLGFYVRRIDC